MESTTFFVDEELYCFWDEDIDSTNLEFIQGFDPEYFEFVAKHYMDILAENDEGKSKESHVSIALRNAYSHALESFFALLFATIQSPNFLPPWLLKYSNWQLRNLVKKLRNNKSFKNKLDLQKYSFSEVSEKILLFELEDKQKEKEIKNNFIALWQRLAKDFLDRNKRAEYNSIKHGFRISEGGFSLRYAKEKDNGEPVEDSDFKTLGSSKYGASYFTNKKISSNKPHYQLNKCNSNWSLKRLMHELILISLSLQNLKTFWLLIQEKDAKYKWPQDLSFFEYHLKETKGAWGFNMTRRFDFDEESLPTKKELLERYNQTFS